MSVPVCVAGQPMDFTSVLGEYKAVCDWPANYFYKQLIQTYPDAKVGLRTCAGSILIVATSAQAHKRHQFPSSSYYRQMSLHAAAAAPPPSPPQPLPGFAWVLASCAVWLN